MKLYNKDKLIQIIEELRKEDCRCKNKLVCLRCAILDELKDKIERRLK